MIIEKLHEDFNGRVLLLHYDLTKEKGENVSNVHSWLSGLPKTAVCPVPGGQPCPTNPLPKVTLFNSDNEVLLAIVKDIIDAKPGSMVPLSEEEMKVFTEAQQNGDMITI